MALFEAAYHDVIAALLFTEAIGPIAGGGLHKDHPTHLLAGLVGLVNDEIGEGAEESARAELEDGFGECVHAGMVRNALASNNDDQPQGGVDAARAVHEVSG